MILYRIVMLAKRPPGRPRDPAADAAILRAGLALFIEGGIASVTIDRIASRAGVGRTTIYRRWSSKEALLAHAIAEARERISPTQEAESAMATAQRPRDFARAVLDIGAEVWGRDEVRRLAARLIGAKFDSPQLLAAYWNEYVDARWRIFIGMLERFRKGGTIPTRTDTEVLAHMILGAIIFRLLFAPAGNEPTRAQVRSYLERLMRQAGFATPPRRK